MNVNTLSIVIMPSIGHLIRSAFADLIYMAVGQSNNESAQCVHILYAFPRHEYVPIQMWTHSAAHTLERTVCTPHEISDRKKCMCSISSCGIEITRSFEYSRGSAAIFRFGMNTVWSEIWYRAPHVTWNYHTNIYTYTNLNIYDIRIIRIENMYFFNASHN